MTPARFVVAGFQFSVKSHARNASDTNRITTSQKMASVRRTVISLRDSRVVVMETEF